MQAPNRAAAATMFVHHLDDDPAWRETLARVVAGSPGFECDGNIGAAIVVLELWHRDEDGFAIAAALKRRWRPPRVLALTSRCDEVALHRATDGLLDGLIWKTPAAGTQLRDALCALAAGKSYFAPEVLAEHRRLCSSPDAYFKRLSRGEQELMPYFGRFAGDAEIARLTGRSRETIRWHRGEIMRRLDLPDSTALARWAMVAGFVPPFLPAPPCLVA